LREAQLSPKPALLALLPWTQGVAAFARNDFGGRRLPAGGCLWSCGLPLLFAGLAFEEAGALAVLSPAAGLATDFLVRIGCAWAQVAVEASASFYPLELSVFELGGPSESFIGPVPEGSLLRGSFSRRRWCL